MKISTKGRYGLRALIDLAARRGEGYVPISSIASRQGISPSYLESIFSLLKKAGIVIGVPGSMGGYSLAMNPGEISVQSVLRAVEGSPPVAGRPQSAKGSDLRDFLNENVWGKIEKNIDEILAATSLQDLIEENERI
jgi:Rrf2 family cysteine metabolism transcriptional repressor